MGRFLIVIIIYYLWPRLHIFQGFNLAH